MKAFFTLLLTALNCLGAVVITSSYSTKDNVYRGNIHCHSDESDGIQTPTALMEYYRDLGYDFNVITDHWDVTADPGVSGILFIPGIEDTYTINGIHHDIRFGIGVTKGYTNMTDDAAADAQRNIDTNTVEGTFFQINHPNWRVAADQTKQSWPVNLIDGLAGYNAIEVWNGSMDPATTGLHTADDKADWVLSHGGQVFLTAGADWHGGVDFPQATNAQIYVYSDTLTAADIMTNVKAGNFYASNGALISSIAVSGHTILVTTGDESKIEFIANNGVVRQTSTSATSAGYICCGNEVYVRVRITGDVSGLMAWTQPFYISQTADKEWFGTKTWADDKTYE